MFLLTIIIINDSVTKWTDVLTAIGTVSAVVLSLLFSIQKNRVKINVGYDVDYENFADRVEQEILPILIIKAISIGEGTTQVSGFFIENEKRVKIKEYTNDSGEYFYFGSTETCYDSEFKITKELLESKKIRFGIREIAKNKEYTSDWITAEKFIQEFSSIPIYYLKKERSCLHGKENENN